MQWFYALNGERLGPVTPAQLATLLANGTINGDTLVWREGFTDWVAWSTVAADNPLPEAGAGVANVASVDAGASAADPALSLDEFSAKLHEAGFNVTLGGVLSRSWENYKSMFWLGVGALLISVVINMAVGFIPFASLLAAFLLAPQLYAGLSYMFLKKARGEEVEIGDMFTAFQRCYGKLVLVGLLQFGVMLVVGIAVAIPVGVMAALMENGGDPSPVMIAIAAVLGTLVTGFLIWLALRFMLVNIVAIERPEGAIDAYRLSWRITQGKALMLLGAVVVMMLLTMVGMLALIIGMVFVFPLFYAVMAQVYHDACETVAGRPPEQGLR